MTRYLMLTETRAWLQCSTWQHLWSPDTLNSFQRVGTITYPCDLRSMVAQKVISSCNNNNVNLKSKENLL